MTFDREACETRTLVVEYGIAKSSRSYYFQTDSTGLQYVRFELQTDIQPLNKFDYRLSSFYF